jgi:mRNA interferase MazF
MGLSSIRQVVIVPFPFSDLSQTKVRPAICLADAQRGDWVLCQITTSPYGDPSAISLNGSDFESGGLLSQSYARPAKLFTAHERRFIRVVGKLTDVAFQRIIDGVLAVFRT